VQDALALGVHLGGGEAAQRFAGGAWIRRRRPSNKRQDGGITRDWVTNGLNRGDLVCDRYGDGQSESAFISLETRKPVAGECGV
jgi:hypothetical protein